MKFEYRRIELLIPYARNSRTHSDQQIAQIMAAMVEFGWTNPVLADADGIVAGHGRVMAATKLYAEGKTILLPNGEPIPIGMVPVNDCTGWTPVQRKAYIIADNKLAENAGWDSAMLALDIGDLREQGFDIGLTGFGSDDLDALLAPKANPGLVDENKTPAVPSIPCTRPGEMWVMGSHRIICGSSTDAHTVQTVLGGGKPHLMVTDPPYGVKYDADWRNHALSADGSPIGGRAIGAVGNEDNADWREAWAMFPGDVAYVWHAGTKAHIVADSLLACGFDIRAQIIWAKSQLVIGRGHYHPKHEPCFYAVKKGATGHWQGDRKQTTLWDIDKPRKSENGHSTQKPVECMRRPIENNSAPGQAVYEPFSGSGTTIIAAEQTGRFCYAVELSPAYVDVAVKRWQEFTGLKSTLENDGRTFDELAAERLTVSTCADELQPLPI